MQELFKKILTARVYGVAVQTPLDPAPRLSQQTGNTVLLKREDLQPTFSYKIRGAANKIAHLTPEERQQGVICASAGNHAQGVAFSARLHGIKARVIMPVTTPEIKVEAVRRLGAKVELTGDNYSEAAAACLEIVAKEGGVFIHPFDDELVIAGQGTVGRELLQAAPDMDAIFLPVGGGGLISGVAAFIKEVRPEVRIIGVEPEDSNAMTLSLQAGRRTKLKEVGLFADGVAVVEVGANTFKLARHYVDEMVNVTTDEICSAIKAIHADCRAIVEPAGALGVAGLLKYLESHPMEGKTLIAVNSGANMNFERLQFVAERTLTGEKHEALFAVTIPEQPGALRNLLDKAIHNRNITELHYRKSGQDEAHIFVGLSIKAAADAVSFGEALEKQRFRYLDLTQNELAKTHLRHMVGGKSIHLGHEVIYRFIFPERANALRKFLSVMGENWSITLFNYRSHGGDFGRVLVGFEIPPGEAARFKTFLKQLNYTYAEETANPAYGLFL